MRFINNYIKLYELCFVNFSKCRDICLKSDIEPTNVLLYRAGSELEKYRNESSVGHWVLVEEPRNDASKEINSFLKKVSFHMNYRIIIDPPSASCGMLPRLHQYRFYMFKFSREFSIFL